jgi:hypothetical protein
MISKAVSFFQSTMFSAFTVDEFCNQNVIFLSNANSLYRSLQILSSEGNVAYFVFFQFDNTFLNNFFFANA